MFDEVSAGPGMNAMMPLPEDVPAPPAAVGWSVRYGFVFDSGALDAAHDRGALALAVDDGLVRDVVGDAPLATVVRLDRDVTVLADEVERLHCRLLDVFEFAVDLFARAAARDGEHDPDR
jgi:hypothetical protein